MSLPWNSAQRESISCPRQQRQQQQLTHLPAAARGVDWQLQLYGDGDLAKSRLRRNIKISAAINNNNDFPDYLRGRRHRPVQTVLAAGGTWGWLEARGARGGAGLAVVIHATPVVLFAWHTAFFIYYTFLRLQHTPTHTHTHTHTTHMYIWHFIAATNLP